MTPSTGEVVNNRYRVDALIGQGGFGAVYRAWDLVLSRVCALKENLDTAEAAVEQFQVEAVVLASLEHPGLPRVTDHFILRDMGQYLVMDFVEGQSLAALIKQRGGPLAESEVLPWFDQVCDALTYLHSQIRPIIHRDIKPQNIIITQAGRAILVDFGISKVGSPNMQTQPGGRAVTEGFSPPEQYGAGHTDPRSDIYALGATLYAALTGKVPPDSVDRLAGTVPLAPPREIHAEISRATESAILKAMEPHATKRFQTAAEMRQALVREAHLSPTRPAGDAVLAPTRRVDVTLGVPLSPRVLVAAAAALILVVAGAAVLMGRLSSKGVSATATPAAARAVALQAATPSLDAGTGATMQPGAPARGGQAAPEHVEATAPAVRVPGGATAEGAGAVTPALAPANTPVMSGAAHLAPTRGAAGAQVSPAGVAGDTAVLPGETPVPLTSAPAPTTVTVATAPEAPAPVPPVLPTLGPALPARTPASALAVATPPASPALVPDLSVAGKSVFLELFSSNSADWPVGSGSGQYGTWTEEVADGHYRLSMTTVQDNVVTSIEVPGLTASDFLLEVDATVVESPGWSSQRIYFRCKEPGANNCYVVDFSTTGEYAIGRLQDGEYTAIQKDTASKWIRKAPGGANTFAVLASGPTITIYANGQRLKAWRDTMLTEGSHFGLGLTVADPESSATIDFDNFLVTGVPGGIPAPTPAAIQAPGKVLSFDRFDDNTHGWDLGTSNGQYADSSYQIKDGLLRSSVTAKDAVITTRTIPGVVAADFALWVDTTFTDYTDDAQVAIVFRCQDDTLDNCYRVRFRTDGSYAINQWRGGEDTVLQAWTSSPKIKTGAGATNNFGVRVRGSEIQVIANDQVLQTFSKADQTEAGGMRLGVGAFSAGTNVDVDFDNLLIVDLAGGR